MGFEDDGVFMVVDTVIMGERGAKDASFRALSAGKHHTLGPQYPGLSVLRITYKV